MTRSIKDEAVRAAIASALVILMDAAKAPDQHSKAVANFTQAWMARVPSPQRDHARQIAGFVLCFSRQTARSFCGAPCSTSFSQRRWRKLDVTSDFAADYSREREFADRVRSAFLCGRMEPRDLIDDPGARLSGGCQ